MKRSLKDITCIAYMRNTHYNNCMLPAASILVNARTLSGLSRRQVAQLADVAPSTVSRIESGEISPTVEMLGRLLDAIGCEVSQVITPKSDPVAIAAARSVLDPSSGLGAVPGVADWLERWKTIGLITVGGEARDNAKLAKTAGLSARIARREGLTKYVREGSWVDIASRIRATGESWAATGGAAANRLLPSADAPWPIFYVSDPTTVATSAGFVAKTDIGPTMSLLPFDGIADVGVTEDSAGFYWVDPLQVLIDCYGGTDRMPEQADALAAMFDSDSTLSNV